MAGEAIIPRSIEERFKYLPTLISWDLNYSLDLKNSFNLLKIKHLNNGNQKMVDMCDFILNRAEQKIDFYKAMGVTHLSR